MSLRKTDLIQAASAFAVDQIGDANTPITVLLRTYGSALRHETVTASIVSPRSKQLPLRQTTKPHDDLI
jgi:hypothetical protein